MRSDWPLWLMAIGYIPRFELDQRIAGGSAAQDDGARLGWTDNLAYCSLGVVD